MLKFSAVFAWLLLTGITAPASARKNATFLHRCAGQAYKTEAIIKSRQAGFVINNKVGSRALNTMSMSSRAGDYVIGLTAMQSTTKVDFDGHLWQDKETGGECFAPRIEINIEYAPIHVYIGKEFQPDSCAYKVILKHEMNHVRLYQENLPRVEHIVRTEMAKRFSGTPLYGPSGQVKQMLENELDTVWRPMIKTELAKIELDQHLLDSDAELAKVSRACLGEVQKVLGFRYY
ncbi:MAG: hypothetical protein HYZ65_08935 [Burkholderiales bacterium]|nr:hypothetical protein [Burkholderiales bacterium]